MVRYERFRGILLQGKNVATYVNSTVNEIVDEGKKM